METQTFTGKIMNDPEIVGLYESTSSLLPLAVMVSSVETVRDLVYV